jgi:Periplasmic binding protein
MQPAQASGEGGGSGSSSLRKWGPVAAIAVAAVVALVLVIASVGGDDDDEATEPTAPAATAAPTASTPPATEAPTATEPTSSAPAATEPSVATPPSDITFPLSFAQAQEQGIEVAWDERCDTELGTLAVRDFFAPDCYAPFSGDNGGETATGVTAESIKVVWYQEPDDDLIIRYITDAILVDDTNAQEFETVQRFVTDYYERFYEFYGRRIELVQFEGSGSVADPVAARADAVRIATEIQPFAVLGGPTLTSAFADELAVRGVPCISCTPGQPEEWYAQRDPFVWALAAGPVQSRQHVAEFIGQQLVGKNAEFAGDEAFRSQPRRFGLVWLDSSDESPAINDRFVELLAAEGAEVVENLPYELVPTTLQAAASQIVAKLKAAGVTSVIFVGDPIAPREFTREATAQEYSPEWILAGSLLPDTTAFARTYDQEQWAHAFGVSHLAARTLPENRGYYSIYRWFTGGEEPPAEDSLEAFMPPMALFTAVLQAAGPELTPETWRDALFALGGTTAAISQPFLSWGEQGIWATPDYNGVDDATLIWWDSTATGPDEIRREGDGMYQYVDGGKRYLPGEWPTEVKLFDPAGAVAIYETAPPGEEPPDYPSPP